MLGALSTPVLDDEERAEVGTLYASNSFQARVRGASLVANRLSKILQDDRITSLPRDARILVYCWRGGDRSGSLAHALSRIGWHVALLQGGYKNYRKLVREALYDDKEGELLRNCVAIGGATGSGKGLILDALSARGAQVVDLEGLASHRGSILGAMPDEKQPTQKHFESRLYNALRELDPSRPTFVELESAKIGRLDVPRPIFRRLIEAPVVEVRVPIQSRVAWIREGYAHFEDCAEGTAQLRRLLDFCAPTAGKKTVERWNSYIDARDWDAFVTDMLETHYDVGYQRSRARDRRNAGVSQEEPFHVDMASTRDDDVAKCAAQILERFSRPKLRVAVHKLRNNADGHARFIARRRDWRSLGRRADQRKHSKVRAGEVTDQEVNELVWRCLGYRHSDGWNATMFFRSGRQVPATSRPHWCYSTYSRRRRSRFRANQALVASIPMKYKGASEHRKVGWTGFLLRG